MNPATTLFVGFKVFTAVVMKNFVFWDITPYSPLKFNRRFEGTCRLHFQGQRISQARSQHEAGSNPLRPRRWRRHVPPKRRLTFKRLPDVVSQKTELFSSVWLILCGRSLFKNIRVAQLNKFPLPYGTQRFIIVFTTASHWFLSSARLIQSTS
jgi:hypothetical protein